MFLKGVQANYGQRAAIDLIMAASSGVSDRMGIYTAEILKAMVYTASVDRTGLLEAYTKVLDHGAEFIPLEQYLSLQYQALSLELQLGLQEKAHKRLEKQIPAFQAAYGGQVPLPEIVLGLECEELALRVVLKHDWDAEEFRRLSSLATGGNSASNKPMMFVTEAVARLDKGEEIGKLCGDFIEEMSGANAGK